MGYLLRLVILVILAWLAYRFVRSLSGPGAGSRSGRPPEQIEMVPCAKCGVHIPRRDALMRDGRPYCSTAHLEADKQ